MAVSVLTERRSPVAAQAREGYIVGPRYDWALFLAPPVAALTLGLAVADSTLTERAFSFRGNTVTWASLLLGVFIHAHLVAVFFRSHANPRIFGAHPVRFIVVPIALYLALVTSRHVLVSVAVLTVFWDVYHSALQTFGFARIYERRSGNDEEAGRRLDWWMNQLLYVGPILAGATMLDHFGELEQFEAIGWVAFTHVPAFLEERQRSLAWAIGGGGALFVGYYILAQWRLARRGHRISPQKVWLLASTGAVSIAAWGFNSFGQAFLVMNAFHALQYFGIVWAFEGANLERLFGVEGRRYGRPLALAAFLWIVFAYGVWVESIDTGLTHLLAITLVVSVMHFWYDGFIWSVRKRQV